MEKIKNTSRGHKKNKTNQEQGMSITTKARKKVSFKKTAVVENLVVLTNSVALVFRLNLTLFDI